MFLRLAVLVCLVQSAKDATARECCRDRNDENSLLQVKRGASLANLAQDPAPEYALSRDTHEIWPPAASPAASLQQKTAQRQQSPTAVRVSNRRDAQAGEGDLAGQQDMSSGDGDRTDLQVLLVCCIVIVFVIMGWMIYWFAAKDITSEKQRMRSFKLTLLCLSYASCSWGMNVVNKSLVKAFNAPTLVTAAQMFMTVVGTLLLTWNKLQGPREQVVKWSLISVFFFGLLVSSFFTYKYLTLSMLMITRNLGPLITLPIETVVMPMDKRPMVTLQMVGALLVILGSTFIYCEKIHTSLKGVGLAILNMVLAIMDRVAQRRLLTTECKNLSTEMCMLLNNLFGLVPTVIMALYIGELREVDPKLWFTSASTVLLLLSGIIGTGICYFALAVQREIAATSVMVLQNAVRMAVVVVGVMVFTDPIGWPWQVLGLLLNFAGTIWYGKSQIDGATAKKNEEARAAGANEAGPTAAPANHGPDSKQPREG